MITKKELIHKLCLRLYTLALTSVVVAIVVYKIGGVHLPLWEKIAVGVAFVFLFFISLVADCISFFPVQTLLCFAFMFLLEVYIGLWRR